jgi:hypothetical protein
MQRFLANNVPFPLRNEGEQNPSKAGRKALPFESESSASG